MWPCFSDLISPTFPPKVSNCFRMAFGISQICDALQLHDSTDSLHISELGLQLLNSNQKFLDIFVGFVYQKIVCYQSDRYIVLGLVWCSVCPISGYHCFAGVELKGKLSRRTEISRQAIDCLV